MLRHRFNNTCRESSFFHFSSLFKSYFWYTDCIHNGAFFGSSQLSPRPMVMLRRGWVLIAILHHSFVLLHFHVFAFYFAFSSLFVHHGVFIHNCFALYIKTPKNPNSKVRPSSHKTPSSIPKKSLASSSKSPSVSATSAGPKESRSRVSTAADVEPRVLPLLWRMV